MKNNRFKAITQVLLSLLLLSGSASVLSSTAPEMLIVGYDGESWYPYLRYVDHTEWKKIEAVRDPAYLSWDKKNAQFFIKTNAGKLSRYDLTTQTLSALSGLENKTFTQLRVADNELLMVELVDGKSRDTQIISMNKQGELNKVLRQYSAQFHPYQYHQQLYYAHVSCRIECVPLIQEIWKKDKKTGRAHQMTRLNATSYLHSVDPGERYGFLSSNQRGFYHLARIDLKTESVHWLTQGQVTDTFPSISRQGELFFIRRTPEGSRLMQLSKNMVAGNTMPDKEAVKLVSLPPEIQKIRYLEINLD